jgi:hypothetical protein
VFTRVCFLFALIAACAKLPDHPSAAPVEPVTIIENGQVWGTKENGGRKRDRSDTGKRGGLL